MQLLHEHAAIALFSHPLEIPEIAGGPAYAKGDGRNAEADGKHLQAIAKKRLLAEARHGPGEHGNY